MTLRKVSDSSPVEVCEGVAIAFSYGGGYSRAFLFTDQSWFIMKTFRRNSIMMQTFKF